MSDFNINMLNFETHGLTNDYINSLVSKSFVPMITLPTRIKQQSATLIDHIWTNKVSSFYNSGIIINSVSDNFPVFYFEENGHQKIELPEKITRQINATTIPAFCKLLKTTSWSSVSKQPNPKLAFENFFEKFNSARDIAFPEVKVKQKSMRFHHNPWMSTGLKVSQKRKEKLFAKKIKFPCYENIEKFKVFNKMYCKIRRAAKKMYYNDQFTRYTRDSKKTWSIIREIISKNKSKEQIPSYFQHNGKIISDCLDIADGFNDFFASIGPNLASKINTTNADFQTYLPESCSNSFRFSKISEMDILRTCKQMKPKLSSGSDFKSTKLFKEIAPLIITPLHYLINLSLETGFVPAELKLAKIVPVFKEGNCHEYTNYRPILPSSVPVGQFQLSPI